VSRPAHVPQVPGHADGQKPQDDTEVTAGTTVKTG